MCGVITENVTFGHNWKSDLTVDTAPCVQGKDEAPLLSMWNTQRGRRGGIEKKNFFLKKEFL